MSVSGRGGEPKGEWLSNELTCLSGCGACERPSGRDF